MAGKGRTVIKRPVFIIMLAFVLGEVIAVLQWSIFCVALMLPVIILIKIITKRQVSVFVVIFLSVFVGYFITTNAVYEKNTMYRMEERYVSATGRLAKISENAYGWNLFLEDVQISENTFHQILVTVDELPQIKIGSHVEVRGKLVHFESSRNPGNFDSRKYYLSLGIYSKIIAEHVMATDEEYDIVRNELYIFMQTLNGKLSELCGSRYSGIWSLCDDKASMFSAILLGNKSELDSEIKALYSLSGIAHILAISGVHISFIGMFCYFLLRKRFRFAFSFCVSIVIVAGFGLMSGMGIATVRAMIMFGLRLLGEVLGKTYDNLTAISAAGIMLMLWNPFVILNSGFQMSFAAIIAIVLVFPVVQNILQIKNPRLNALLLSLNISFIMNPIIAYNYFELPTYAFLLNIIVVPLMSIVMISGLFGTAVSFINIFAGRIVLLAGCAVLELYTKLCIIVSKMPFSNVIVGKPSVIIIVIYYLILVCFLFCANRIRNKKTAEEKQEQNTVTETGKPIESKKVVLARQKKINRKFSRAVVGLLCVLNGLIYMIIPLSLLCSDVFPGGRLQVTFLDVGQGDGIVMRLDCGTTIMVDGGSSSVERVGHYRMIPFLKSQCVRKIDYAIMTHADNDHISGLIEMLEESDKHGVKVKNLVLPDIQLKDDAYDQMIKVADKHGVKVLYITKGDIMQAGDVKIKCIHPAVTTKAEDRNDYSTVLSVTYKKFSMLLTGDISSVQEETLSDMPESHYTVLKVAHHGSKYSTSDEFLNQINPDYSVISVGEHNMYGHPGSETLRRLKQNGSKVLRTDESGGITISTDGKRMKCVCFAGILLL